MSAFLQKSLALLGELERAARWRDLAAQAAGYRQLADELRERRPDVADAIDHAIAAFFTADRARRPWPTLHERDGAGRGIAAALVAAFGAAVVPACVGLLDDPARASRNRSLVTLMCAHAALLAPALVEELGHCGIAATRVGVRVLGFAGAGYEAAVAEQVEHGDEPLVREALRALARMGTGAGGDRSWPDSCRTEASGAGPRPRKRCGTFRRREPPRSCGSCSAAMTSSFSIRRPSCTCSTARSKAGIDGLDHVLAELEPLRFRFWNPGLVRVALKARELRAR